MTSALLEELGLGDLEDAKSVVWEFSTVEDVSEMKLVWTLDRFGPIDGISETIEVRIGGY